MQVLSQNSSSAYKEALEALPSDSQDWWQSILESDGAEPSN